MNFLLNHHPLLSPKSSLSHDQNQTHKDDLEQRGIFQTRFQQKSWVIWKVVPLRLSSFSKIK